MPELAAHLERVAKEFAQQLEDRAIQRAHPPEGEVSVGDEPWECALCGAESATNEVKHNVTCPILAVAAALAACARERDRSNREYYKDVLNKAKHFAAAYTIHETPILSEAERAVGEKGQ